MRIVIVAAALLPLTASLRLRQPPQTSRRQALQLAVSPLQLAAVSPLLSLLPSQAGAADQITFEALLKTLVDSPRDVERVEFLDAKGDTAYAMVKGARLDITGIPPDTPLQNLGPLKLAAVCRDTGVRAPCPARHT